MARDALRRVDAPVRPARTVLWTLTWALALCLPLAACDGGDPADPAVSAPPGASPRDLQPVAAPLAPAPVVLASAADVAAFNARGAARLLGGLRLTGRLPAQVTLPHLAQLGGALEVDAPAGLTGLTLPALHTAAAVTVRGGLTALTAPRLAALASLDLAAAPALAGLTLPALEAVDTLAASVVPGARWRLPALRWLGALRWAGGDPAGTPHRLTLDGWLAGGALVIEAAGPARLEAPGLDRLGALSLQAPPGSRVALPALQEVTGDVRWALADFPPPALTAVDGALQIEAGATQWPALQGVGGDLTVAGPAVTGVFLPVLAAVGGRVRVQGAGLAELVWPRLRWVGDGLAPPDGPGVAIADCPALRLVALDDLARVTADDAGVAVRLTGNGALCTAPRFGAVPPDQVRYEAACAR